MPEKKLAKKMVKLIFPQQLVKEPVTFRISKKYNVIPNIRRARVTKTVGELFLELEGKEKNIEEGIEHMVKLGVDVKLIEGDIVD